MFSKAWTRLESLFVRNAIPVGESVPISKSQIPILLAETERQLRCMREELDEPAQLAKLLIDLFHYALLCRWTAEELEELMSSILSQKFPHKEYRPLFTTIEEEQSPLLQEIDDPGIDPRGDWV